MHFIDSTGLSALEAVMRTTGCAIVLEHVQSTCRRVLEITHLDQVFEVVDEVPPE
jgi:anti-anti-sigma factor